MRLGMNSYSCYQTKSEETVREDLLTNWSTVRPIIRRLIQILEVSYACRDGFNWPSSRKILTAQQARALTRRKNFVLKRFVEIFRLLYLDFWWSLWYSASDGHYHTYRLCWPSRTESHWKVTRLIFKWFSYQRDLRTFVRVCIHCLSIIGGEILPRTLSPVGHEMSPHDLLQFDYVDPRDSNGDKYALVLRNDLSDYNRFYFFPDMGAENAATAIIEYFSYLMCQYCWCPLERHTSRIKLSFCYKSD